MTKLSRDDSQIQPKRAHAHRSRMQKEELNATRAEYEREKSEKVGQSPTILRAPAFFLVPSSCSVGLFEDLTGSDRQSPDPAGLAP